MGQIKASLILEMDLGQYGVSLKKIKKTLCSVLKLSYCFAMQSP